jgi:CRP/FNR family transcriptional regulator, cyclic AMP receptor protein
MAINAGSFFDYPGEPLETPAATAVAAHQFMAGRNPGDWATLYDYTITRKFTPGELLVDPAYPEDTLYLIGEGNLEVLAQSGTGHFLCVAEAGPGSIVGEIPFFTGTSTSRVQAVSAGGAAALTMERFEVLALHEPQLARLLLVELGRLMAERLRQLETLAAGGTR